MILHIPHASTDTLGKSFLCDLSLELERMTDIHTDLLFDHPDATKIIFPISRLICDVERFEDDSLEVMSKQGMGVCYATNSFGRPLRHIIDKEKKEITENFYRPHHLKLSQAVENELHLYNKALIIDCHSFSNTPLPHEKSQNIPRPDICIGSDSFHTPKVLIYSAIQHFTECGYTVSLNDPFAGALVPMKFYQQDKRVQGIMIEINRDIYKSNIEKLKQNINIWLSSLI